MRALVPIFALAMGLIGASTMPTNADPEECREAIDQYKSAADEVRDALQQYASCIADSQGHDDCSSEFSNLQSAQGDLSQRLLNTRGTAIRRRWLRNARGARSSPTSPLFAGSMQKTLSKSTRPTR